MNTFPFRVSTATVVGTITGVGTVPIRAFFDSAKVSQHLVYMQLFESGRDPIVKGKKETRKKKATATTKRHRFDNQLTLQMVFEGRNVNAKVFANGRCIIAGLGEDVVHQKDRFMHMLCTLFFESQSSTVQYSSTVVMMNADFKIGHTIDRADLFRRIMHEKTTSIGAFPHKIAYEPSVYPPAKITFMCSDNTQATACVFQTGSVIVTGAKNIESIRECIAFIYTRTKL